MSWIFDALLAGTKDDRYGIKAERTEYADWILGAYDNKVERETVSLFCDIADSVPVWFSLVGIFGIIGFVLWMFR